MMTPGNPGASFYIHIPFCEKKCPYCHFYVIPNRLADHDLWWQAWNKEWEQGFSPWKEHAILSVYFGGGTPSLLAVEKLDAVLTQIERDVSFQRQQAEITLEVNPEKVSKELLSQWRAVGINRLSLGAQSFDASHLQRLGRGHSVSQTRDAVFAAVEAGFENITLDLMYDLPEQSLADWKETLEQARILPVTHFSLYNLTIEPHTPFDRQRKELEPTLPSEETSRAMYCLAQELLSQKGFSQYEISAFARPGYEAEHNQGYWTGRPFWGMGPSAFSYARGVRWRNIAQLRRYHKLLSTGNSPVDFREELDPNAQRRERLILALRRRQGIPLSSCKELETTTQQQLEELLARGWLKQENDKLRLTDEGILFYDSIATLLV